jgi:AcrR family transcriptional regulator
MTPRRNLTRQRLIKSAFQLFVSQGVTATTTRQIAELAGVNEVTLFRQFNNKHGLLQAVLEDTTMLTQLGEILGQQANASQNLAQALAAYASLQLQALEQAPELVRSLIGESGQYSPETVQALGQGLAQVNDYTTQYLATILQDQPPQHLSIEQLASLLNSLLVGYIVLEVTSPFHEFWPSQPDFLTALVELFLQVVAPSSIDLSPSERSPGEQLLGESARVQPLVGQISQTVEDLPAPLVHLILRQAKKLGLQDYALAYVLFAAGLSATEVAMLLRSHSLSDAQVHLLQVNRSTMQQVPVNQWILGQHYGTYTRNPLTQWLKSRKDDQTAMFLNESGHPISALEIRLRWQGWTEAAVTGRAIAIEQAQQTWRVEMLTKGMSLEDLSVLTGLTVAQLQPYADSARKKAAIDQAIRLDQKLSGDRS